jgi:hydroxyacylglutathione hydrolase
MRLRLDPLPAFADNYIWCLRDDEGRGIVVDPGDARPVLAAAEAGLRPLAILVTHHHPDHTGGVETLQQRFDIPCFAPADPRIPGRCTAVGEGAQVDIPGIDIAFTVLAVPGHTRSHIAFHGDGLLFCGDTLFSLGCGRLFEGSPAQMLESLDRIAALPDDPLVCCTHEYTLDNAAFAATVDPHNPDLVRRIAQARAQRAAGQPTLPTRLDQERRCNPFLRIDAPAVRAAVAVQAGRELEDRCERFAALRRWKDGFRA